MKRLRSKRNRSYCLPCSDAYLAAWYAKNPQQVTKRRARGRTFYQRHPDKLPERIVYMKNYMDTHRAELNQKQAARGRTKRQIISGIIEAAKSRACMDCGFRYPPFVMDFDHRDRKEKRFNIGAERSMMKPDEAIAEIAKCDVVCSNCHRYRTNMQRVRLRAASAGA